MKFAAAVLEKGLARADRELLERLEAVGREAGGDDREVPDALLGEAAHGLVGIGLEPLLAAEARLEGQAQRLVRPAEPLPQQARGLGALAMVGVAELEIALGQAVERGEHDFGPPVQPGQVRLDAARERLDIVRIVMVGRCGPDRRLPALGHQRPERLVIGGGRAGRGVLRVEREQRIRVQPASISLRITAPVAGLP